ncbi:MAG TPA: beta-propeller fold lactonase family protein [Candidatus Sulfotelmatobacter sp.]|nr:beta-propeller fold lactonase family protein [Candidatus Sulfotelmatobacter sp.]
MKALISIVSLFTILLVSGCLGSGGSSTATPTLAFLYLVGMGDNSIRLLNQKTTGELNPALISAFTTSPRPVSLALHPSKNFIYAANQTANTVSGYSVDHTNGILTPVGSALPPTPVCSSTSVCSNPVSIGINSAGTFLFTLNQGVASTVPASISVFSIDTTRGLLTPVAGSPFPFASLVAPNPQFLTVSPNAGFLYVSNGVSGTISAFSIAASGALSEVAGSPFTAGASMAGLRIDPKGQFLYAADSVNSKIAGFTVAVSGALAPVAGSPFTTDLGPVSLAIDSSSAFLFCANQGGASATVFKITSGALTQVGAPYPLVPSGTPQPSVVIVDPSNTFVYVGNTGSRSITAFSVKSDGTMTQLTNSPFLQSLGPQSIVMTQ